MSRKLVVLVELVPALYSYLTCVFSITYAIASPRFLAGRKWDWLQAMGFGYGQAQKPTD
jgi:hypothetical protein